MGIQVIIVNRKEGQASLKIKPKNCNLLLKNKNKFNQAKLLNFI